MADKLIRSIPLIQRFSRHNENADLNFRSYLKDGCRLSNQELDKVVLEIGDRVSRQIDCTQCANCCKTLEIIVNKWDIIRLSKHFNFSEKEFTIRFVTNSRGGGMAFKSPPCPFLGANNRCTVYEQRPAACRRNR